MTIGAVMAAAPAARGRMGATDCERLRPGPLAQPVNTLTSLGYVVAAVAVHARHGGRAPVAGYCTLLALVGLGSAAFHGPQPPGAGLMHDAPIPALLGVALATPAVRSRNGRDPWPGWTGPRGVGLASTTALALACYAAGRTGAPTCNPESPWQPHGAWHLLSAATFVVVADILHGGPR